MSFSLSEEELKVMDALVAHYGYVDEWETNHWAHVHALYDIAAQEVASNINISNKPLLKKADQLLAEVDSFPNYLDIFNEINSATDLSKETKNHLMKMLYSDHQSKQAGKKYLIQSLYHLDEKGSVGRPRGIYFNFLYKFLDYLTTELGSINKAIYYCEDHPLYFMRMNTETVKREYRKYRNQNNAPNGEGEIT